jgi:DinB superfamily
LLASRAVPDGPDIARSSDLLVAVLGHAIRATRFAVRDLTDQEFFWEPVSPCWGVRRRGESDAATQWGSGDWVVEMWDHDPPRVTTIGWRLVHLTVGSETYIDTTFEDGASTMADADIPGSAEDAVRRLHAAQDRLLVHYSALNDEALTRSTPTHWGEELPLWQLLWTSIVEQFHHGAEIGALRDLKRGYANTDWWPELQGPDWWPLA